VIQGTGAGFATRNAGRRTAIPDLSGDPHCRVLVASLHAGEYIVPFRSYHASNVRQPRISRVVMMEPVGPLTQPWM
jgi:hypothetical protein